MESEKELYKIWKKYINKNIYRVTSDEYTKDIIKNGINPKKDPLKKIRPKLERLYNLVLDLENKGYIIILDWYEIKPIGSFVVRVSREDLEHPYVDFTPSWKDVIKYKKQWKGGAIASNAGKLCKEILKLKLELSKKDISLLTEILEWSKSKYKYKNKVVVVRGNSKAFETAKFQHHLGKIEPERYWESPYGSFNHFKKVINKYGLDRYKPFFKGEKVAHFRVIKSIRPKEIKII